MKDSGAMRIFLTIYRDETELEVEISSDDTTTGYVDVAIGSFAVDQPIPLTPNEQEEAEEMLLSKALSLAKRDIDFEVDDYRPSNREQDAAADRYFAGRGRV